MLKTLQDAAESAFLPAFPNVTDAIIRLEKYTIRSSNRITQLGRLVTPCVHFLGTDLVVGIYVEGVYCILVQFEESSSLATRLGHTQPQPFFVSCNGTHTPMTSANKLRRWLVFFLKTQGAANENGSR